MDTRRITDETLYQEIIGFGDELQAHVEAINECLGRIGGALLVLGQRSDKEWKAFLKCNQGVAREREWGFDPFFPEWADLLIRHEAREFSYLRVEINGDDAMAIYKDC
jgi:hypothetical protein